MSAQRIPLWSRIAFVVLLPVVAYSVGDYVESRRLEARLNAIRQRGEPTSRQYQPPAGDAAQAERFYRAASALVTHSQAPSIDMRNRVGKVWLDGRRTPEALEVASADVAQNREALSFLDRAANLPFVGFQGGTSYNLQTGNLLSLARLCELRAFVLASQGNGDAALASFVSQARLVRALDLAPIPLGTQWPLFSGLTAAAGAKPSAPLREAAGRAFAEIDHDDRLRSALISSRAFMLSGSSRNTANPFVAHILVRQLDAFAALIAAADRPWPNRIDAVNAVDLWPVGFASRNAQSTVALRGYTKSVAEQVRRIRCARVLVSEGTLSVIDPLTGKPLEAEGCHL